MIEPVNHQLAQYAADVAQQSARILNKSQAEALYGAMCALNNVGARMDSVVLADDEIIAKERDYGLISILNTSGDSETYPNQAAFATAYGL